MACRNQLEGVNTIANMLSPAFSSIFASGYGEGSFSHAELEVRETAEASGPPLQTAGLGPADIARVSAIVKAKTTSEFYIARGDTWDSIMADPKKLEWVQSALQQVSAYRTLRACCGSNNS